MSLLVFLFYWVGVPILVLLLARLLFRRAGTPFGKGLVIVATVLSLLWLLWLAAGERWWLDYQVRKLCAEDGGVKVYETVSLSPEKFNKYGQINFYRPIDAENALGPDYVWKWSLQYYREGNPSLYRSHTQVYRKLDGKLLGESVFYKRSGGDLPGPWHGSSFMCPELSVKNDILRQIFIHNTQS